MSEQTSPATTSSPTDRQAHEERIKGILAIVAASVLGVAAVLTAWSAFRQGSAGDAMVKGFADQQVLVSQANDAYGQADTERSIEEQFFITYAVQNATGNVDAAAYLEQAMSPELWNAVSWWNEQPDDGPVTPFVEENPYYADLPSQQLLVSGDELMAQADETRAAAEAANSIGDRFGLANVFFAIVLFLAGVATLLSRWRIQAVIVGLGALVLIGGVVIVVTTPGWASL